MMTVVIDRCTARSPKASTVALPPIAMSRGIDRRELRALTMRLVMMTPTPYAAVARPAIAAPVPWDCRAGASRVRTPRTTAPSM
ncbi:hypothetical protein BANT918_00813 [Brevibacterium antiquum CNRZ 918]|uniref:Uncharacterized protein n=1 Tax=Brevibacterium antiquum CNRZ 918 TaxID=1255637 RepID=A0A2H1IC68_9MICO|nr:hypothetical protein BANT918_00813 [Brevibacterium antiquum CNRZ 918]